MVVMRPGMGMKMEMVRTDFVSVVHPFGGCTYHPPDLALGAYELRGHGVKFYTNAVEKNMYVLSPS